MLKVTFLGTGTSQGVPVIACNCEACRSIDERDKRLRTSVLIENENTTVIIDTGPDFRQQMLRENVKKLDAVLYTHEHRDHIAGLDDIRAFNFVNQQPMDIYSEARVTNALKYEFPYIFDGRKYPGIPRLNMHEISDKEFTVNSLKIIPVRVMHYRLPILGFRIGELSYITDADFIAEEEKEKLIGSKYLVINALRKEKHISHFCLEQALDLVREISPKKAFLIHLSHQMGLQAKLQEELPANVIVAYDGLKVEF